MDYWTNVAVELRNKINLELYLKSFKLGGDYVESFGIMGFFFGLIALSTVLTSSNKVKELEKRIDDLEGKS